ncbi:MAG: tetratricopeptide repeat protein [Saprospiraceae bacterium]|nr:tetratricopeptide repeat protein [Saprospiraceae bacterium]
MKLLISIILFFPIGLLAQSMEKSIINEGNIAYKNKKYDAAAQYYQKATKEQNLTDISKYNLGNALYQLEKQDDAITNYNDAIKNTENNNLKSKAYHNIGNSYFQQKAYDKSVDAYQQSSKVEAK